VEGRERPRCGTANAARCEAPPDDFSFDADVSFAGDDLLSVRISECTVPYGALASVVAPRGPLGRLVASRSGMPLRYRIHRPGTEPEKDTFYTPPTK